MANKVISATEFRARALALLEEVETKGGRITITRRGRPVATLGPVEGKAWGSSKGSLAGKVRILGDIVGAGHEELWESAKPE